MARFSSWIERSYGRDLVQDRLLTVVFVVGFPIVVLIWYLIEPSAITSATVLSTGIGILGVYIAVWMYNRKHIKTTEEQYCHKMRICVVFKYILDDIDNINNNMQESPDALKKYKEVFMVNYYSNEGLIRSVNSSSFVPYIIKNDVDRLLVFMLRSITKSFDRSQIQDSITLDSMALIMMGALFNSDYFMHDRCEDVQYWLRQLRDIWPNINNQ